MKKRKCFLTGDECSLFRRIVKIMKLTTFILLATSMMVSASLYSQSIRLSLKFNEISYAELFKEIENQTEFRFAFSNSKLDPNQKVQIDAREKTLEEILDKTLPEEISYEIIDRYVVIMNAGDRKAVIESQQQKIVSGVVTDESGLPLPGVTVLIKGTTQGTVTIADGNYNLANVPDDAILVFSFVGMLTQEIPVGNQAELKVTMKIDAIGIEEVVAIGYGVQKKINMTGAVGVVDASVIEAKPVTNVQELLQGKTPGLNITKGSGAPGSGADINIRGNSTIGGSSGVLVIIDGVPGNLYTVNPNDVESISVLKDAASAAIYGSRAANGVILVTTKRGSRDKELEVSVTSSIGVTNPLHFIDFVGGEDFMNLYNLARKNEGNDEFYTEQHFADLRSGKIPDNVWYEEVFEKNQVISNNHVSLSGKTRKLQYNISGSYDYESEFYSFFLFPLFVNAYKSGN